MGTRWWIPPIWLLTCAIVQGSLIPALGVRQGRPDFVLQSVVIWAVTNGAREALGWALVGGVCLDAVSMVSGGGTGLAESALWDERGRIGRSAQSLLVERR